VKGRNREQTDKKIITKNINLDDTKITKIERKKQMKNLNLEIQKKLITNYSLSHKPYFNE
jgi:hypothetical protein